MSEKRFRVRMALIVAWLVGGISAIGVDAIVGRAPSWLVLLVVTSLAVLVTAGAIGASFHFVRTPPPMVTMHPSRAWGRPCVGGVSTEAVAGMVAAGESVAVVMDEFSLTRLQVLLACWERFERGSYQAEWWYWFGVATQALTRGDDPATIPDPPALTRVEEQ